MRNLLIVIVSVLTNISSNAQYKIVIDATFFDQKTQLPVAFVDISISDDKIKSVANLNGHFHIEYDENAVMENETISFFKPDYKPLSIKISNLYRLLKNTNKIYLSPLGGSNRKIGQEIITQQTGNIFGKVTSEHGALQDVSVKIKNSLAEVFTNSNGDYRIDAGKDDILVFSFIGMKSKEILVNDEKEINVALAAEGTLLDEVILTAESIKEEKINLGFGGKKNFDEIGYDVKTMTSKDIQPHYNNLMDLLNGKFAGIVVTSRGAPKVYIPGRQGSINNNSAAIFDVDGGIYESFPPIDVQQIETISIIKSITGTNKYGTLGKGGVVVIRTKTASGSKAETKRASMLATGNDYVEQVSTIESLNHMPNHLKVLQGTKSLVEAKQTYKRLKQSKDNLSVSFYLDCAEYFFKSDQTYATSIFDYVEDLANDNPKALKSIAFKYEALGLLEKARLVYQRIALLRPKEAQSYRDLALIYAKTGYYNESMGLYKKMLGNHIPNVEFSCLEQPILDELKHLLAFHKNKVEFRDLPVDLLSTNFKQDLRIVFEWNDPNVEFELQFVNPQKKFFKWAHTKFDNRDRIINEIKKGYTTEVYIIDNAEPGNWIINIEALDETHALNPNYLKYTIYKNYGLSDETKVVKIVQLENIKQKVTLDKITYK